MTFTASLAPETRTSLNGDNTMWNPNDQITIFDNTGAHEVFTSQNTVPSLTATFKGKALSGNEFFAVYGNYVNENLTFQGAKTVILNIPNTQYVSVDGGFDENAVPLLAYSTSNELYFKNVATLLTFTVGDDNVNHVRFETDQLISGNALVAMDDKNEISINEQPMNPAYEYVDIYAGSEAKKEVFKKGVNYCVAIFPKTVSTFDWKVAKSDEKDPVAVKTYFNPNPITFVSSAKVNMGELKHSGVFIKGLNINSINWTNGEELVDANEFYVIKNLQVKSDAEFKIVYNANGSDVYKGNNTNIALNTMWDMYEGNHNFYPAAGTYTLVVNKDKTKVMLLTADHQLVKIYLEGGFINEDENYYAMHIYTVGWGTKWPGYTNVASVNNTYEWVIARPKDEFGKEYKIIFNNNNNKKQLNEVVANLSARLYFKVENGKCVKK